MAVLPQWNFWSMGPTKSVHPYCRLAIITMQRMPKTSCNQRSGGGLTAAVDASVTSPPGHFEGRAAYTVRPAENGCVRAVRHHGTWPRVSWLRRPLGGRIAAAPCTLERVLGPLG